MSLISRTSIPADVLRRWQENFIARYQQLIRSRSIRNRLKRKRLRSLNLGAECLEMRAVLATAFVLNTADAGGGSFRQAIIDANNHPGPDVIDFSLLPGSGVRTIALQSALPQVLEAVVIDGSTVQGYSGIPLIELQGAQAGVGTNGLVIARGPTTVRGLVINSFSGAGVELLGGSGISLVNNRIGTDPTGTIARSNGGPGIDVRPGVSYSVIGMSHDWKGLQDPPTTLTIATDPNPHAISTADLNGDGKLDLVTANLHGTVSVALNSATGPGSSAAYPTLGATTDGVTLADFNSDGTIDIATSNRDSNNVSILLNSGDGTFAASVTYAAGSRPHSVNTADLDGDGDMDLAVVSRDSQDVTILLNNGNAVFAPPVSYSVGIFPFESTIADFNGDGRLDLAVDNALSDTVSVLMNLGNAIFAPKVEYVVGGGPHSITSADFDGDGKVDLATADNFSNTVSILRNNGDGTFASAVSIIVPTPVDITAVDINGDGYADLATANNSDNSTSILLNDGAGGFGVVSRWDATGGPRAIATGDFDADGNIDVAITQFSSADVRIYGNLGSFATGGNLIAANQGDGIRLEGSHTVIAANSIGANNLGNAGNGISIGANSRNSVIGLSDAGNSFVGNGAAGIAITGALSTGHSLRFNQFESNGFGIDLGADGATANDSSDADSGPNHLQNSVVLTQAVPGATTNVMGTVDSIPSTTFTIDLYTTNSTLSGIGQGQRYLGTFTVSTNAAGYGEFDVAVAGETVAGEAVTATATSPDGSTSEFSSSILVESLTDPISWDGGGGNLLWSNPLNWTGDVLPGPTDDVVISVPGEITVELSNLNIVVNSVFSEESLSLVSGSLKVTGASEVQGTFTAAVNTTLLADGGSASFLASGPTTINSASLRAMNGGVVDLPNATDYLSAGDGAASLQAFGIGSRIALPGITTLTGYGRHGQLAIEARDGGLIDLSGLQTIPAGTTQISAFDTGSTVDVSGLTTWSDGNFARSSFVSWGDGGVVLVDALQTIQTVGITASTGDTLVFPALTHVGGIHDSTATVLATGAGSRIELPVLSTMDGSDRHGQLEIQARNGGVIDMPLLTTNLEGTTIISAFDPGSLINMSSLQSWTDNNFARSSNISWGDGGLIRVDALQTLTSVGITASTGDTLHFPSLSHLGGIGDSSATVLATGAGSRIELPVLATMDGSDRHGHIEIQARNGGVIDMPSLTVNLEGTTHVSAFDLGSLINMSSLVSWTDNNSQNESRLTWGNGGVVRVDSLHTLNSVSVTASNGNVLLFPVLQRIGGVNDSSGTILATGAGSRLEFPAVTVVDGPDRHGDTSIQAQLGGVVNLPELLMVEHGSVNVQAFDTDGDASGSLVNMPALHTWNNNNTFRDSYIRYGRSGYVNLDSLEVATAVSIYATGGDTVRLPALHTYNRLGFSGPTLSSVGAGSRLELPLLSAISGEAHNGLLHMIADVGGTVDLPVLSQVSGGTTWARALGTNSTLKMPSLQSWSVSGSIPFMSQLWADNFGSVELGVHSSISSVIIEAISGGVISGGLLELKSGAILRGNSQIDASVLNSQGTVQPGINAGVLSISGDYTQAAGGTLAVQLGGDVAGTQHDVLNVFGTAFLNGTLSVSLINGFVPIADQTFEVLQFSDRFADFHTKSGVNLGGGLYLAANYCFDDMTLIAGDVPDSGQQLVTAVIDSISSPRSAGAPIMFSGTATGTQNPVTLTWDFGDGSPNQTGAGVSHVYALAGQYTVTLTASDSQGALHQTTDTILVELPPSPIANADYFIGQQGAILQIAAPGVLLNDLGYAGAGLTAELVTNVNHGVLQLSADGSFVYQADSNFFGVDSFVYQAIDVYGTPSSPETVTLEIIETNYGPVVIDFIDRGQLISGSAGNTDRVQIVVSLAEATNPAVEAEFDAYQSHLNNGFANIPFNFTLLGVSVVGFESFDKILAHGSFRGSYVNPIVGNNYSEQLVGTAESDLIVGNGGNDTLTGLGGNDILIGGSGNDTLDGGDGDDVYLYSGTADGFDTYINGPESDSAIATTLSTIIGINGYANGVELFQGQGDTIIRDTNYSATLNFSDTLLTGIAEIDAAGGNDSLTASNLSSGSYRGGTGDDILNASSQSVTWLYSGTSNGFDAFNNGTGPTEAVAQTVGTVIGVNGYANGVDQFLGQGDTIIRDTNYSATLNFSDTVLNGIAEIDAAGGNDTLTASNLSSGSYRGGTGNDTLNAGSQLVTWSYSGTDNGFDTFNNGIGASEAVAQTVGTVIGVNGYANGVDQFQGQGDTIIRDTNYSATLNFSNTFLTGIAEIDAAGGNDTLTASNLSSGSYRGGTGDDIFNAGNQSVTWLYSGTSNGFDTFNNGTGATEAVAQTAGTVIGVNGYANGVDQFLGQGDTIIRDTNYSATLNFSNTLLSGISEIDAAGGNDSLTASNLSSGSYRGGTGDDILNAGSQSVTWLYSGATNGFDIYNNGTGTTDAVAQTFGTVIGVKGYTNGVDQFQGRGDTIIRDTNYSATLNFSTTWLIGIAEIDAAGGNDVVIVSLFSSTQYRLGSGNDLIVFADPSSSLDVTVADFLKSGVDRIDLRPLSLAHGYADLQWSQAGATAELSVSGLNVHLLDTLFAELEENDFLF